MEGVVEVEAVEELEGCCLGWVLAWVWARGQGEDGDEGRERGRDERTLMSVGSFR